MHVLYAIGTSEWVSVCVCVRERERGWERDKGFFDTSFLPKSQYFYPNNCNVSLLKLYSTAQGSKEFCGKSTLFAAVIASPVSLIASLHVKKQKWMSKQYSVYMLHKSHSNKILTDSVRF